MPLCAAACRSLQGRSCKHTSFLTFLTFWQPEGQGFDPPQLHQSSRRRHKKLWRLPSFEGRWPALWMRARRRNRSSADSPSTCSTLRRRQRCCDHRNRHRCRARIHPRDRPRAARLAAATRGDRAALRAAAFACAHARGLTSSPGSNEAVQARAAPRGGGPRLPPFRRKSVLDGPPGRGDPRLDRSPLVGAYPPNRLTKPLRRSTDEMRAPRSAVDGPHTWCARARAASQRARARRSTTDGRGLHGDGGGSHPDLPEGGT